MQVDEQQLKKTAGSKLVFQVVFWALLLAVVDGWKLDKCNELKRYRA